jgi:hypothetical protein
MVPATPTTMFILIQASFSFGILDSAFHPVSVMRHFHQTLKGSVFWCIAELTLQFLLTFILA